MSGVAGGEGRFGTNDGSDQGIAGVRLQNLLARVRVLYVSATGASDVNDLAYARRHACRRFGAVAPAATPAATTEKLHPGHDRRDRRQIDMVVAMSATLGPVRHIGPAMTTGIGHDALGLVRRICQRPRLPLLPSDNYDEHLLVHTRTVTTAFAKDDIFEKSSSRVDRFVHHQDTDPESLRLKVTDLPGQRSGDGDRPTSSGAKEDGDEDRHGIERSGFK